MAILQDLINQADCQQALAPQTLTQATTGTALDLSNDEVSTGAIVSWGTPGAGQTSATIVIEECATTNGTFSAVTNMTTTITGTLAGQTVLRGLRQKQYLRARASTVTGTTPSLLIAVEFISQKRYANQASGADQYPSS